MSTSTQGKARGGIGGLVDAARRIVAFSRGSSASASATTTTQAAAPVRRAPAPAKRSAAARKSSVDAKLRRIAEVRKLAGQGIDRIEIARRTGLSHDTVAMLLNISGKDAAESAASGTFFRAFQWRASV